MWLLCRCLCSNYTTTSIIAVRVRDERYHLGGKRVGDRGEGIMLLTQFIDMLHGSAVLIPQRASQ